VFLFSDIIAPIFVFSNIVAFLFVYNMGVGSEEYLELLNKFGVEYEKQYLFDWFE